MWEYASSWGVALHAQGTQTLLHNTASQSDDNLGMRIKGFAFLFCFFPAMAIERPGATALFIFPLS